MLRLLADENFDRDIVRGVLRRRPELDLALVQTVGLSGVDDLEVLAWAASERRVVLTHDVNTMIDFAMKRLKSAEPMAGLFIVHQKGTAVSDVIDDILLLDDCSETAEWTDLIQLQSDLSSELSRLGSAPGPNGSH